MSRQIDNEYVLDCLQRWGNHCSVAFLDPTCQFFGLNHIDGVIGYRTHGNKAVIFGDPASELQDQIHLMRAFHDYCKQHNKSIICIGSSAPFAHQLLEHNICASALAVGNEILLDARIDPTKHRGADGSSLRNKWCYSIRRGLMVHEYTGHDATLEQKFEALHGQWLAARKGPQIYLAQTELFTHRKYRRLFYATHQDNVVGLLILTQLKSQQGFVINVLMLAPNAPTTTSEFIILSVLQQLAQEGPLTLSAGLIPQAHLDSIYGFGTIVQWLAKKMYSVAYKRYKLHRKQQYWKKFAPVKKELFVLFERQRVSIHDTMSILHALHAIK